MAFWLNLIGYQLVWLASVYFAANGRPIIGMAVAGAFVLAQLAFSRQRGNDARLVVAALAACLLIDGALAGSGWLHYASDDAGWIAPAWMLALWAAFAMTWNHSLTFLRGRLAWAVAFGALGGPLAYAGAARGFDAVQFNAPVWRAVLVLAVAWAIAMPLLAALSSPRAPAVVPG